MRFLLHFFYRKKNRQHYLYRANLMTDLLHLVPLSLMFFSKDRQKVISYFLIESATCFIYSAFRLIK